MIQHDPSRVPTLNFPAPSGEGEKRMNCSVAGSDSRRPWPHAGSVASAHGHDDVAKPWEMLGRKLGKT